MQYMSPYTNSSHVFFISNFRRVLYVVCFLPGDSPASEFYKLIKFRRRGINQKKTYNSSHVFTTASAFFARERVKDVFSPSVSGSNTKLRRGQRHRLRGSDLDATATETGRGLQIHLNWSFASHRRMTRNITGISPLVKFTYTHTHTHTHIYIYIYIHTHISSF
jgi:hypothetical protein